MAWPRFVQGESRDQVKRQLFGKRRQPVDARHRAVGGSGLRKRRRKVNRCRGSEGLEDRKSVAEGKSVSVRVALGGRRVIKKTQLTKTDTIPTSTTLQSITKAHTHASVTCDYRIQIMKIH